MRLLVSGLIRDSGKMFEEQRSPNSYGKFSRCHTVLPVVQVFPLAIECGCPPFSRPYNVPRSVSLPLIHHGQQRLPRETTPQIFGEQRVMPLP